MIKRVFSIQLPGLVWAGFIFYLCTIPGDKLPEITFPFPVPIDKCVHAFLYMVLSFLLMTSAYFRNAVSTSTFIAVFFVCAFYGISIELIQKYFAIHRGAEILDELANICGILLGMLSFYILRSKNFIWFK